MSETLDDLIDRRGLPLGELARLAELDVRAIYDLRRGRTERPRAPTVAKLAKALRVSTKRVRAACAAQRRHG